MGICRIEERKERAYVYEGRKDGLQVYERRSKNKRKEGPLVYEGTTEKLYEGRSKNGR